MVTSGTDIYKRTASESIKPPLVKQRIPLMFDSPTTWRNWHQRVAWVQAIFLLATPIIALYGLFTTEMKIKTLVFYLTYGNINGLCITAGYHRFWAHRSYMASLPLKLLYAIGGAGAAEGSAYWWARGHRAHHRWTDTDKDPYSAQRGFFFSHFGWMLVNRPRHRIGYADVTDLKADPIVAFQHKYYPQLALVMAIFGPILVCGLGWGDFRGGLFYAFALRVTVIHHSTFFVNSLAHFLGDDTYDNHHSPRDHWLTAFLTLGEGYHNFHHQFPQDYRNAILYTQYDPTKWFIKTMEFLGFAYELKTFPTNEIEKGRVQMVEFKLEAAKQKLKFGTPIDELPVYTWEEFQTLVHKYDRQWILIEGILYDMESFEHPGGAKYITTAFGKDMTTAFNGGIYNHSNGARNLLTMLRVGVLVNGVEVMSEVIEKEVEDLTLYPIKNILA
ncbi:stearoyl-CoA desaturase [Phycomyces nitens]|nr:stearoyl-CoA desaturase [Phycomyces nitens]